MDQTVVESIAKEISQKMVEQFQQDAEERVEEIKQLKAEIVESNKIIQQHEQEKLSIVYELEQVRMDVKAKDKEISFLKERLRRVDDLSMEQGQTLDDLHDAIQALRDEAAKDVMRVADEMKVYFHFLYVLCS